MAVLVATLIAILASIELAPAKGQQQQGPVLTTRV